MADGDDDNAGRHLAGDRRLSLEARMTFLERDSRDHAKTITSLVEDGQARAVADSARSVRDEQRDKDLGEIKSVGRFMAGSVGLLIIGEIARVVFHIG